MSPKLLVASVLMDKIIKKLVIFKSSFLQFLYVKNEFAKKIIFVCFFNE